MLEVRKRHCMRFSLTFLLGAVTLCCCLLAFRTHVRSRQLRALNTLERLGGYALHEGMEDPPSPFVWLFRKLTGKDLFVGETVVAVRRADISISAMKDLTAIPCVTSLDLEGAHLSAGAAAQLANMPDLQRLVLTDTNISNEAMQHIRSLRRLELLDLCNTAISDVSLEHLAGLQRLQILELHNTQITDEGVHLLARIRGLRQVSVSSTLVTREGAIKLRKALPHCEIIWYPLSEFESRHRTRK